MPEICRFFGIIIAMYYNDHAPPHFHARYGDYEIKVDIESGDVLDGEMPQRAKRLIIEWWRPSSGADRGLESGAGASPIEQD